jgi:predicted acylesterase/phospholipase RssA/regulator of replication initiation timing
VKDFNDIKNMPDDCTAEKIKDAVENVAKIKLLAEAGLVADATLQNKSSIIAIWSMKEDGIGLIQYLLKHDKIQLIKTLLSLLDETTHEEISSLLELPLEEAIKSNNISAYDVLTRNISAETLKLVKYKVLRLGEYRFIMHVFMQEMNHTVEEVLEIAQNPHDLAYLLSQFPIKVLHAARDADGNNILHLALKNRNKNIFCYLVNHETVTLMYETNSNNITPVDMVYADIQETSNEAKAQDKYKQLMLLDQAGVDLESEKYADIFEEYKKMPDYHHRFLLTKQVKRGEIHAVAFNGGGVKGQAFIAAYQEALNLGIFDVKKIKQFAGTSAGAITAGIFAMGFDITRCQKELIDFKFEKMMEETTTEAFKNVRDNYAGKWTAFYHQNAYYYLIYDILSTIAIENLSLFGSPLMTSIQQLLKSQTGIFKPTYLRETLTRLVKERIESCEQLKNYDPAHITFKDLRDNPDTFKELIVYITNLSSGQTEKCSAETTPNMSIIDGIVYSASFPIFFEAAEKHEIETIEDGTRQRVKVMVGGEPVVCCDGGVLKNDPVDAFDTGQFNEHALTFMLVSSNVKKSYEFDHQEKSEKINHVLGVLHRLYTMSRASERKNIHLDTRNHSRIVYIDTKNVGTLDFANAKLNAPILEAAGRDAIIDYLNRRTANKYSVLSSQTISILMEYKVAKYSTTDVGQVIEIKPGKRLEPTEILHIYAVADDSEVNMLRSIVNPNQRDPKTRVNAMLMVSSLHDFDNTKNRLIIAGARPVNEIISLSKLPDYLKRGEDFLTTGLSIAKLQASNELFNHIQKLDAKIAELNSKLNDYKEKNKQLIEENKSISEIRSSLVVENERLTTALTGEKLDNTSLRKKYLHIRNATMVTKAIDALRTYKDILGQELVQEEINLNSSYLAYFSIYKSYTESNIKLKKAKKLGVEKVISELENDQDKSASEIIDGVKQKYQGFFNGSISQRTKNLCTQMITAEENVKKVLGQ